jgi:hypothetical protein
MTPPPGEWRELRPPLGRRVDGLVETDAPVWDSGGRTRATNALLDLSGSAHPWGYLARLRLRPRVVPPSHWTAPLVIRITARATGGTVGALCVADDLRTVLSNAVYWTEDDGEITLTLVVYTYPGQGWLVFRNAAVASPETRCRVSAIEAFAVDHALPAADPRAATDRTVIYTAITNHYDTLQPPRHPEAGCEYVCFTDDPDSVPAPWKAIRIARRFDNPRLDALWYRVHPHLALGDHDVSVYVDGRFVLRKAMLPLIRAALADTSVAVFDNAWWDCLYLAGEDDVRQDRYAPSKLARQLARYRETGFPRHLASLLPGVLMRRHHAPEIVKMAEAWWDEILRASSRDQLSFTYLIWRQGVAFRRVWLPVHDNPYVKLGEHNFVDYYRS